MPTYDYVCGACKRRMEIFHPMQESKRKCPECGALKLTREIGAGSGFIFKGSGFYITDYRNQDYKAKAESEKSKVTAVSPTPSPAPSSTPASASASPAASSPDESKPAKKSPKEAAKV